MSEKSLEKLVKTLIKLHKDPEAAGSFLRCENIDSETLIHLAVLLADKAGAMESDKKAAEQIQTQMALDYKKVETERNALKSELKKIRNDYSKLLEHYRLNSKVIFGDHAENMDRLFEKMSRTLKMTDENDEIATNEQFLKWTMEREKRRLQKEAEKKAREKARAEAKDSGKDADPSTTKSDGTDQKSGGSTPPGGSTGQKKKTRKRTDTSNLPQFDNYVFDETVCDEVFGKGNYRIVSFDRKEILHHEPERYWKEVLYYPVVAGKPLDGSISSGGSQEIMLRCKPEYDFWPHSNASADLIASIMYKKCIEDQPYYRQALEMARRGLPLRRSRLATDCIWTTQMYLDPAALMLEALLKEQSHNQCDETSLKVNELHKKAWIWCHCSSELYEGHKICVYKYETSRSADHLRRFYEACRIILECDAYTGYDSFEKRATLSDESGGAEDVKLAHCWMHYPRSIVIPEDLVLAA